MLPIAAQLGVSSGEQIRFGFSAGLIMMPELGDVAEQHFITSRDAEENQQELRLPVTTQDFC